jgi:hypothetical protein
MQKSSYPKKTEDPGQSLALFKRRAFLRSAGLATASTALLLSGCKEYLDQLPIPIDANPDDYVVKNVRLGGGDTGVLNYAYTLEQLEAAFYIMVTDNPSFSSIFNADEQRILRDLRNHEVVHVDFFRAALGANAIPRLKFDFKSVDFSSRQSVLQTSKTFEDLGVAAYNGAGRLLKSADLLLIAGKIVSVEARHASAIREVLDSDPTSFAGDDVTDSNGLDRAFAPAAVISAAQPFIVQKIDASALM